MLSTALSTVAACQTSKRQVQDQVCRVVSQEQCAPGLWIIRLQSESRHFECDAGQFVMLDLPDPRFFFRRPFSVLRVLEQGQFEILYKVVGQGTRQMAALQPGEKIKVLTPLGKSFPAASALKENVKILLLGGGIGIAPLFCWLEQNPEALPNATVLYAARTADDLGLLGMLKRPQFSAIHRVFATDDGSYGGDGAYAGRADGWLSDHCESLARYDAVLLCGPMAMMRACVKTIRAFQPDSPVHVSLENHMPCGTGVCSGCVVFADGEQLPLKVCLEGPVMDASRINWDDPSGEAGLTAICKPVAKVMN